MVSLFAKIISISFWLVKRTYREDYNNEYSFLYHCKVLRSFDQISSRLHNSSLEGAMELKFPPFCSS